MKGTKDEGRKGMKGRKEEGGGKCDDSQKGFNIGGMGIALGLVKMVEGGVNK